QPRPKKWTDLVNDQLQLAKKKQIVNQKRLFQYVNGQHGQAIDDLIDLINSTPDKEPVKIWDPFVGPYYLDFLTFLSVAREIRVLSDLSKPPGDQREVRGFKRYCRATSGCILDFRQYLPSVLVQFIQKKQGTQARQRFDCELTALKAYLDDL